MSGPATRGSLHHCGSSASDAIVHMLSPADHSQLGSLGLAQVHESAELQEYILSPNPTGAGCDTGVMDCAVTVPGADWV